TYGAVADEQLSGLVLRGKQLFYDSQDQRLALEEYVSCASCHNDGGQDGRVWDLTGFGEGLRNTIDLRGRAGLAHGPLHWSGNFDEVQDFEGQIRGLSGGGGLIEAGEPHPPLGAANTGRSADLDALAAYVASLAEFDESPFREPDGSLTPDGEQGKLVFQSSGCTDCHSGPGFTDSPSGARHDVGTLLESSGGRLGGTLDGIDTPTLRGVWSSAPYLHDGRADDLEAAVNAHQNLSLTPTEMAQLVEYLRQIDGSEPGPEATGGDGLVADENTVALYHFDGGFGDSSGNGLDLTPTGNVTLSGDNLGWMANPGGAAASFGGIGDQLSVSIPDSLVMPGDGPLIIDARIFVRGYLGSGVGSVPIISLEQSWDSFFNFNEDIWGGPGVSANGISVVSQEQWEGATTLGQWQRLQISYDGAGTTSVYIDGGLVSSVASAPDGSRDGGWQLTLGNLDAELDELMISRAAVNEQPPPTDTQAPSVTLSTASVNVDAPFVVAIAFSESVTGLSAGDLSISNGIVTNLSGGNDRYDATISPVGEGEISIGVPAGAAEDAAGNANTASNSLSVTYVAPAGGGGGGGGDGGVDELEADGTTVALYHFNGDFGDSSGNGLTLAPAGNVSLATDNLAWMTNPGGAAARFGALGDQLVVSIPDSLVLPSDGALSIDARIFVRGYLGFGVGSVPILSLEQSWDTYLNFNEDIWSGPGVSGNGVSVVNREQWEAATIPGQWQRLQISYDGAGVTSVYIDGNL
ncbi:MAG: Ig-like domain-containing protein, partial [Verrucomicrobiales bacterium]